MAFKSMNHDDEKIFYNRLWKLMEERELSTARALAQALFAEGIVPVDSTSEAVSYTHLACRICYGGDGCGEMRIR